MPVGVLVGVVYSASCVVVVGSAVDSVGDLR